MRAAASRSFVALGLLLVAAAAAAQPSKNRKPERTRSFKCGGVLTGLSGFIGSEGFPGVYPPNSKCTWKITVRTSDVTKYAVKNGTQSRSIAGTLYWMEDA